MEREIFCELLLTPSGKIQIDKKALNRMGWFGALIKNYRSVRDEHSFVLAMKDNLRDGKVHIPIKVPGTITHRCSAGFPQ